MQAIHTHWDTLHGKDIAIADALADVEGNHHDCQHYWGNLSSFDTDQ